MELLVVKTNQKKEIADLTGPVNEIIAKRGAKEGLCHLFVKHTTCALITGEIGEGTAEDFLEVAEEIVPRIKFRHAHDPSHAWSHMASSIIGPDLAIPVEGGKLALGTWQSVMLVELDGPKRRSISVTFDTV